MKNKFFKCISTILSTYSSGKVKFSSPAYHHLVQVEELVYE